MHGVSGNAPRGKMDIAPRMWDDSFVRPRLRLIAPETDFPCCFFLPNLGCPTVAIGQRRGGVPGCCLPCCW